MKINKIIIALAAAALLLFTGCDNSLDEKSYETERYSVSGKISFANSNGASPVTFTSESGERTATTSFNNAQFSLELYAYMYNEEGRLITDKKYSSAKAASDGSFVFDFAKKGRYAIFAELSKDGTLCARGNAYVDIPAFDSRPLTLSAKPVPYGDGKIQLKVAADTSTNPKIAKVSVSWEEAAFFNFEDEITSREQQALAMQKREKVICGDCNKSFAIESGTATIAYDEFCGGAWQAKLDFEDALGNVIYSCREVINVYPGFTTNLWYGNSPCLQSGNFKVTGNMVNNYISDIGNYPLVLYNMVWNMNQGRYNTSYYIVNSPYDSLPADETISNTLESHGFAFDKNEYFYVLDIAKNGSNKDCLAIKSNKSAFETFVLPVEKGNVTEYRLFIDIGTDTLWVFVYISGNAEGQRYHFYGFNKISETTAYTEPDYHYCLSEAKTESGGSGTKIFPEIVAAYQGMFYIVARNSYYTARYLLCVNPVDNISGEIDGGGSYFTAYGATQIDLAGMGFGTNMIGSKDIIYQEGKLYILIGQYGEDLEGPGDNYGIWSRGGVVTVDVSDLDNLIISSEAIGLAKESQDQTGKAFYLNDFYDYNPLYTSAERTEKYALSCDNANIYYDDVTVGSLLPKIYAPSSEEAYKYFYGPTKFIAVKPKKLVIADEGYVFYTDNDVYCYKNINRIVEIDLENFAFTAVNTAVAFKPDGTSDIESSGFLSVEYFGEPVYDSNGELFDGSNGHDMTEVVIPYKG